jgi:N-(2-amino-2-carboxyethyl)-L-glutamate synthase
MMNSLSIASCIGNTPIVRLNRVFGGHDIRVYAKLELLNPGGSVKDRPAKFIIEQGLRDGSIPKNAHLIESTSGNLGVALAMIMKLYGAHIEVVSEKDACGGYLETRIARVKSLLLEKENGVWINQYANVRNWQSHYHGEGEELLKQLPERPDYLVMGVSTSGTILGIARRLREAYPDLKVIGVDALGSMLFGNKPGKRFLPGIGASRVPELLAREEIDDVIYASELESCESCLELVKEEGIFAGGSSGSVVAAIKKLIPHIPKGSCIATLFPDRGDRYMDLVYNAEWRANLQAADAHFIPQFARKKSPAIYNPEYDVSLVG